MTEVLAPVGSVQALKAAIYSGADAVYLGLDLFNARIKADNFNKDNIKEYTDYCHLFGVKVYVTFNTSVKENEKAIFAQYVDCAAKAGVDAFIVTDLGCLDILRQYDVPLHGSTQIGVHNLAGAKVLEKLGFTRVVVARETLFEDIKEIRENTSLEIEYFVHGALCVSFSGGCLLSSVMSGDSGNRGRCNQPCRLKYTSSFSSKEKYLLSPKDQCFIGELKKLADIGVDSFKIEGRLKQPHYVGEVVSQYRKAVNALNSTKTYKADFSALKRAYNRGNFTRGYNFESSKEIMYDKVNGTIGECVGKIAQCKKSYIYVELSGKLSVGDGLKIIYKGEEVGGMNVASLTKRGKYVVIPSNRVYPVGSEVCVTSDIMQINAYSDLRPKLPLDLTFEAECGKPVVLKGVCKGVEVKIEGGIAEVSQKYIADAESVKNQLMRFGQSDFYVNDIDIKLDRNNSLFIPSSLINAMRRELVEGLKNAILSRYEKGKQRVNYDNYPMCFYAHKKNKSRVRVWCELSNENDISAVIKKTDCKFNLVVEYSSKLGQFIEIILKNGLNENKIEDIYLKLPRVARGKDYKDIDKFLAENSKKISGIYADNLYGVYLAEKYELKIVGGIGLNIYNHTAGEILGLDDEMYSVELNKSELWEGSILYAYGPLPVMTLLHCPVQVNTGCTCSDCKYDGDFYYADKRGKYKIKRTKLNYCQFNLYNQQITDIIGKTQGWKYRVYLNLTECDTAKALNVICKYNVMKGISEENSTYGHLFRGVK